VRQDGERFVVVDGERRLRAARLAKLQVVAVIIEEKQLCEAEVLHRQIIANLQRADLSPCERAQALKRLIDLTGWQVKDAAAKCGLSNGTATKLLAVLSLPAEIQQKIASGEIPASGGYELARVADPAKQAELAQQVSEGQLTRDELSEAVRAEKHDDPEGPGSEVKRLSASLGDGDKVTVAGKGLTLDRVIALLEEVLVKARAARKRGVDLRGLSSLLRKEVAASA
jgi:ParB/RepB/Spo0J family partition protein